MLEALALGAWARSWCIAMRGATVSVRGAQPGRSPPGSAQAAAVARRPAAGARPAGTRLHHAGELGFQQGARRPALCLGRGRRAVPQAHYWAPAASG